jgi:hypothetical protein
MEPLDLTGKPPRPCREKMLGMMFLPRTIDKLRAELPGGNIGDYVNHDRGFSAYVVKRLGLDMEEFRTAVASAGSDAEVEAWLQARIDPSTVEPLNAKLESFSSDRMPPEDQALLRARHPVLESRPDLRNILDILDAEDRRLYSTTH